MDTSGVPRPNFDLVGPISFGFNKLLITSSDPAQYTSIDSYCLAVKIRKIICSIDSTTPTVPCFDCKQTIYIISDSEVLHNTSKHREIIEIYWLRASIQRPANLIRSKPIAVHYQRFFIVIFLRLFGLAGRGVREFSLVVVGWWASASSARLFRKTPRTIRAQNNKWTQRNI